MRFWALAGALAMQHAKLTSIEILSATLRMLMGCAMNECGLDIGFIL